MKKLIIFPFSFHGKTEFVLKNYLDVDTLFVYPNFSKIKEVKKLYSKIVKNCLLPEIKTVKSLALQIIEENSEKKIVNELQRYLIILKLIKESGRYEGISIIGIGEGINNLIKDIKTSFEEEADYEKLKDYVEKYPWKFEKNKEDLLFAIEIIKKYQDYLEEENLLDIDDIYREAEKYTMKIERKRLIIENFYEILPSQRNFFASLIKHFPDVIFTFSYDKNISPDVKEMILDKTLNFIKNVERWELVEVKCEKRNLDIECYNFPSQDEEVKGIVKLIGKFLKENPSLKLDDFSIICPDMPAYRETISRIFKRYEIPSELIPGFALNNEPGIISLLEILTFVQSYDWKTLMSILTSPYFKNIKLKDVKKFSSYTREKYEGIGFTEDDFKKNNNPALIPVKECAEILDVKIDTVKNWGERLLKVSEKLKWEVPDVEVKNKFYKVVEGLNQDFYVSSSEFLNILKKALQFEEVEQARGEGLRISGVIESTGIEKKISFVPGVTEENFPNAPKLQEIFIPDRLKEEMGLSDYKLRIARDRLDMHRIINENEKVIFTYPSKIEGRNQMKSIFLFNFPDKTISGDIADYKTGEIFKFNFSMDKFYRKFLISKEGKNKIKMGVTQLEKFLKCPYKFYLELVEEIKPYKVPEIEESSRIWGNMIHQIMKEIFKEFEGKIFKKEDVKDVVKTFAEKIEKGILESKEISSFYKDIMRIRAKEVIAKFERIIEKHTGNKIVSVEKEIIYEGKNFILKGIIDRIEENENGIYIIDIKTGTSSLPSFTENDFFNKGNIQIPSYMWMYKNKFKIEKEIYGAIWNFSFKEFESKKMEEKIYEQKRRKIDYFDCVGEFFENIFEKMIKGEIDFQPEENQSCFYCEYKTQCPNE